MSRLELNSHPKLDRHPELSRHLERSWLWADRTFLCAALVLGLGLVACAEDVPTDSVDKTDVAAADTQGATGEVTTEDTTVAPADVQPDTAPSTDTTVIPDVPPATDVAPIDTAEVKALCPGGANCDCKESKECDTGLCLETPDGKKCGQKCSDAACSAGYGCKVVDTGGGDPVSFCVPLALATCAPCQVNKDCQVQGLTDALCIPYGGAGKFCGSACTKDEECPGKEYGCVDITDEGTGKTSKQCKLKTKPGTGADCSKDAKVCGTGEVCDAGKCAIQPACACSAWAKQSGLKTTCTAADFGKSCSAERKCGPNGLEDCTAKVVPCSVKGYKAGTGKVCTTNADCSEKGEECNKGKCDVLIGECKGEPACGSEASCAKIDPPVAEICDTKDNDCDGATDEEFTWKSPVDGAELKWGASCGAGPCAGGSVVCESNIKATCSTASKAKATEDCNNIDDDCNGKLDDATCDDKNECTDNTCDSKTSTCANPPNSAKCDDKNACTGEDGCDGKGACIGKVKDCSDAKQCTKDECDPKTGTCANPNLVGSCDDANACSVGDVCGDNKGVYECLPGKDPLKCDDANACTDDVCDTLKGCQSKPNASTFPCYSGDEKTKGVGVCKEGVKKCDPATGKIIDKCENEVVPAKSEACDGKDDTCNGQTDEGCKPTSVAITFSSAYVQGKSGDKQLQMLVGPSGPVGKAKGTGKYEIDFGFLAWLKALLGGK